MKKALRILTFLGLNIITVFSVFAQQFPASAVVTLGTPKPLYLSEYYAPGATALTATLVLSDFSVPSFNTKIRITIEGNNLKIRTKDSFLPVSPINLTPGVPTVLSGSDLQPYLAYENVDLLSGDPNAFIASGGKLPEGFYKFCVEVLDYRSGVAISREACAMANIFREQPPRPLQPLIGQMVQPMTPQNILLSWQVAPGGSPILAATSQYVLEMYQVIDVNANPLNAVVNGQAQIVFTSTALFQTTLNLDLTTSQLQAGYKYVWRVRALDDQGRDVYANNGYSEWAWFYYGYPTGGSIALSNPAKGSMIRKNDPKQFNWGASSEKVQGQQFDYQLKIVEVNEGQTPEDAIASNSAWHTEQLASTYSTNGASFELTKGLEPKQQYAWQVKAFTETQEIAESEVWDFYGPPVVEKFNAGNFTVFVLSTENTDINNLDGRGYVQLSESETDTVSCDFTGVDLKEVSGLMFMEGGEVIFDLSFKDPIELTPDVEINGSAEFVFEKGKLDKFGLYYGGKIEWPFPHAITAPQAGMVVSKFNWFVVDENYKIAGTAKFDPATCSYELLNPYQHKLNLDTTGDFRIATNKFELRAGGTFQLNDNIPTSDGQGYIMPFVQQAELQIIEVDYLLANAPNYFTPIEGSSFSIKPWKATIDLSEDESPGVMQADKGWKGVIFPKFTAIVMSDFDPTNQITLENDQEFVVELNSSTELWTSTQGMHMKWDFEIERDADESLSFNSFRSNLEGTIRMDDGTISDSYLKGKFYIPFLDATEQFTFTTPLTNEGVMTGYLEDDLEGRTMVFNPYGGENKIEVEILRAAFVDNERIDMNLKINLPSFKDATFKNVSDFRVYGDNYIGFTQRNGSKALDRTLDATYAGYKVKIKDIGAAYENGRYSFAILGDADYGPGITGDNGPPKFAISSVMLLDDKFEVRGASVVVPDPVVSIAEGDENRKKIAAKSFIKIENKILEFAGWINLIPDHPDWGNVFTGTIEGKMKFPTDIPMSSNILVGNQKGVDFWYFDAYFQDLEGSGVPVMEPFNMVGFEGRAYSHMKKVDGAFVVDGNTLISQNGYVQLIDGKTSGAMVQCDMDMELKINKDNSVTQLIKGDISLLNKNIRKNNFVEAGMQAGKALVEMPDIELELDVSVPLLDEDYLGIKISTSSNNAFSYTNEGRGVSATLTSTNQGSPGVGIDMTAGDYSFNMSGNADAVMSGSASGAGATASVGFDGSSEATFDIGIADLSLNTTINTKSKFAESVLAYGDNTLTLTANKGINKLEARINDQNDHALYTGYVSGAAILGYSDPSNLMELSMNPSTEVGTMTFKSGTTSMTATADTKKNKGVFGFKNSSMKIDALADKAGIASFHMQENEGKELTLKYDGVAKDHLIEYIHSSTDFFSAALTNNDYARLSMGSDGTSFGIAANLGADSGRVFYSDRESDFNFKVEPKNLKAKLTFDSKNNFDLLATVDTDSAYALLTGDNHELSVSGYNTATGRVHYTKDNLNVTMFGDYIFKSGTLDFTDGERVVNAAGCKNGLPNKYTKLVGVQGEFGSFSYKDATYEFGGYYAKDDSLAGKLIINGSGYEAGYDKNATTYSIRMVDPSAQLMIRGDLNGREIGMDYSDGGVSYTSDADFNIESGEFTLKDGSDEFSYASSQTGFSVNAKQGPIEISSESGLTGTTHELKSAEATIKASEGLTETNLIYTDGTVTITTDDDEDVIITDGSNSYSVEESMGGAIELFSNGSKQSGSEMTKTIGGGSAVITGTNSERKIVFTKGSVVVVAEADGTDASIEAGSIKASNNSAGVKVEHSGITMLWLDDEVKIENGSSKVLTANADEATIDYNTIKGNINVDNRMSFEETSGNLKAWMDEWTGIGLEKGDQKAIADIEESILLQYDPDKYVKVEEGVLDMKIDQATLHIDPADRLEYNDGTNNFLFNQERVKLTHQQSEVAITPDEFILKIDNDNFITLGKDGLDFKYNDTEAKFDAEHPLSFVSDLGSFNLGIDGIELGAGDVLMALEEVNSVPTLIMDNTIGKIQINDLLADVHLNAGIDFGVNPEHWFEAAASEMEAMFGDSYKFAHQGLESTVTVAGEYLASITSPLGDINIPDPTKISVGIPDLGIPVNFSLYPDMHALAQVGEATVELLKDNYLTNFSLGDFTAKIPIPTVPNRVAYDFSFAGFNAGFEAEKQKMVQVELGTDRIGNSEFGYYTDKGLTIGFTGQGCHFEVSTNEDGISGKKSGSCGIIDIPEPLLLILQNTAEPPQQLGTAASIPAGDGPQYMEGRVSDEAGGFGRGSGEFYIDTENEYIGINAAFTAESLVCLDGAMTFVSDKGDWYIDIGTSEQKVSVKPLCYDIETSGYFHLDPEMAEFYASYSWEAELSVDIGVSEAGAGLSTKAGYSFGMGAALEFDPLAITSATVDASAYADVKAKWWLGISPFKTDGEITVASASLAGKLTLGFDGSSISTSGSMDGHIEVLDVIEEDFSMSISGSL